MDMILLILVLIVLASLLYSRRTSRRSGNYRSRWTQPQDTTTQEQTSASIASQVDTDTLSYDKAYQKKWLLTMNEKAFYRQLCSFAAKKNMPNSACTMG